MAVSVFGFLSISLLIWGVINGRYFWKVPAVLVILSAAIAYCSLLLLIKVDRTSIKASLYTTLSCVMSNAVLFIVFILTDLKINDQPELLKLMGILGILGILGTIVTPILVKVKNI